jgi:polyisoprenoid-binding protein YceI
MKLRNIILGLILLVVLAGGAVFAYIWFSGGSGEVSIDIEDAAVHVDSAEGTVFQIVPDDSLVTFTLDEDLRGNRNTVIGRTVEVAGDIVVNFENPQVSQIGTIRVNARSLTTDDEMRNRAIRSTVLRSAQSEFEFIDFSPSAINGLPESIEFGTSYPLEIAGDLTMVGQTHPVTFIAEVTLESETRLIGTATTTISYGDWGIPVPTAPGVANVASEAILMISFVAEAAAQ